MNDEKKPLDIFKDGIKDSKKYYYDDFPDDVSDEDIEKAIMLLMNQKDINDYLRRVKMYEDSRIGKYNSNHCAICNKEYASFGITIINWKNEEETKWYCLKHEAFGNLTKIKSELKHNQDKSLDDLYRIVKEISIAITDKFEREYESEV